MPSEARYLHNGPSEVHSGELIFIPSGWWHSVLNIEESVAITQNVVSSENLARVLDFLPKKEKQDLFQRFTAAMREKYPDALKKAEESLSHSKKQHLTLWEQIVQPREGDNGFSFSFSFE